MHSVVSKRSIQWVLTAAQWIRFGTFTLFYFAQGIPIGLFAVAMPIYLAHAGASLEQLSWYGGVVGLPWAFKLVVGPFMDRFTFLSMGFRRPWVILSQTGLVTTMVVFTFVSLPSDPTISALTWFAFATNAFAASQDVAVDGMAIDILKEDERGRANAFMAFGQASGFSAFGALSGFLLVQMSVAAAAAAASLVLITVWITAIAIRERSGEKILPWTSGQAAAVEHRREATFGGVFGNLVRVLFLPMSLLLILMEFLNRARDGIALSVFPKYAQEVLSIATDDYTYFVGIIGFAAAVLGVIAGPFIDRHGIKVFLFWSLLLGAVVHVAAWIFSSQGAGIETMGVLYVVSTIIGQVIFVATIAIFMTICWSRIAATQFAIYMSLANLSRSAGAFLFSFVAEDLTFHVDFLLMAVLLVLSATTVIFFDVEKNRSRLAALEATLDDQVHPNDEKPRQTRDPTSNASNSQNVPPDTQPLV